MNVILNYIADYLANQFNSQKSVINFPEQIIDFHEYLMFFIIGIATFVCCLFFIIKTVRSSGKTKTVDESNNLVVIEKHNSKENQDLAIVVLKFFTCYRCNRTSQYAGTNGEVRDCPELTREGGRCPFRICEAIQRYEAARAIRDMKWESNNNKRRKL